MRVLFSSQGIAGSQVVRPCVPLVWGQVHPATSGFRAVSRSLDQAPKGRSFRLDCTWTQGGRFARMGEGAVLLRAGWPGANYGVRPPDQDETPLSAAEALYLLPTFEIRA
jgi:hypothetical protein